MRRRTIPLDGPLDLVQTLGPLRVGPHDPTLTLDHGEAWRTSWTSTGAATLHLRHHGDRVDAQAWGAGAEEVLDGTPGLLGVHDDPHGLCTTHPLIRDLHRRAPGLRMTRTDRVSDIVVQTVLGQKVTGLEQRRAWQRLCRLAGESAPGPRPLLLPPSAPYLASLPYPAFHPAGVERRRAETIRTACSRAVRLDEAVHMRPDEAFARITAFPGIGPWTAAICARIALGDPDQVETGDYHLPHLVSWNLAGEPRGDDARMLELLEPFRGQRGRVLRLLEISGRWAPRRGPRLAPRAFERH